MVPVKETNDTYNIFKDYSVNRSRSLKKIPLLSISLSIGSYEELVQNIIETARLGLSDYVCLANVHTLVEAHKDSRFAADINQAYIVSPDGKPLTWAMKMLHGIKLERVAGMDLLPDLLYKAAIHKLPVYFYGGKETMLKKTLQYVHKHYPDLTIAGSYSPPFRKLTALETDQAVEKINNSGALLVLVVLGCPKQEKWMASMKGRVHELMVGVGGALPVMIGSQTRAPVWMQDKGLEWVFRLIQEPIRLFRRYLVTNTTFIYLLTREYVLTKLFKKR